MSYINQESLLGADNASVAVVTSPPVARNAASLATYPAPQKLFRTGFSSVIASGVDTNFFTIIQTGTSQTVSQSSSNLVITAGTTANAETILRSTSTFSGPMLARVQNILSQRIINNNFAVEIVDVIGDGLSVTVNSATSITVTIPSNPFTSANVGQFINVGAVQNISATAVPGRYAIASVSGNNVNFTVAGWPASGSGTCSLYGWNYMQAVFSGTTATQVGWDCQRRGWNSGSTTATINTSASPGTMLIQALNDGVAYLADQLVATATANQTSQRASRNVNLPEETATYYLQLRATNGSTAPASSTTWTLGTASVENYVPTSVAINDVKFNGLGSAMPVNVSNTPAVTISSGTVTTVSTVTSCTTVGTVTNGNAAFPGTIADVASAALTTTTTTAAFTPTFGEAFSVSIPVTAVSGTTPTLDVVIQESMDSGTNWYDVYHFPRITATGFYWSPSMVSTGNRFRYVQTVGGTTPSFTRAINRFQSSNANPSIYRTLYDRAISLTTLNSTTSVLWSEAATNSVAYLEINIGAATTPPSLQLEGSNDNSNWLAIGAPLAAVASSTVSQVTNNNNYKFMRARVSTAGTGVTAGYVLIKAY